MDDTDAQDDWQLYKSKDDPDARNRLIEYYLPLVKRAAERLHYSLAGQVEVDDLYSSGLLGLMDAVGKYIPSRQIKFSTFSAQRIRGAMLDDLRDKDWVPRLSRVASQKYQKAYNKLFQELERAPSEEEMMTALEMNEKEFHHLCMEANILSMVSIQNISYQNDDGDFENDWLPDSRVLKDEENKDRREFLEKIIADLPDKKKAALVMYYFEEMTLKEISKVLDITEGRVSQILSSVLAKFRTQYQDHREEFLS